jgi:alpha-tubulin suppressor-like RCC1 family protein
VGGASHTCALLDDGTLACWGRGEEGQLGTDPRRQPALVSTLALPSPAVSGAAGTIFRGHMCVVMASGQVACWGNNDNGQIGDGTLSPRARPTVLAAPTMVREVGLGINHSCALLMDGTAQCWGDGLDGALGNMSTTDSNIPVPVMGLTGATRIAVGGDSACAIVTGNQVRCWGDNDNGQLGIATTADSNVAAAAITGLTDVVELAAGADHFCARLMDGTVRCWGDNDNGQLGVGTTADSTIPTAPIMGLANVVQIVAGANSTCARLMGGTVQCWGDNFYGQLGVGSTMDSNVPVAVPGLSDVVDLSSGNNYVCARRMDGSIRCWGYNDEGNLGNGTLVDETSPVTMNAPTNVRSILAGNSATCVITVPGAVQCVGWVGYGQLGNGQTLRRVVPALVP